MRGADCTAAPDAFAGHQADLEAETANWRSIWAPSGAQPIGDMMQAALVKGGWATDAPWCSVGEIKAAAPTFSRHTDYGVEGMHPRQIGWLSDEALECIAEVFDIFSASGVLRRQMMTMTNP